VDTSSARHCTESCQLSRMLWSRQFCENKSEDILCNARLPSLLELTANNVIVNVSIFVIAEKIKQILYRLENKKFNGR